MGMLDNMIAAQAEKLMTSGEAIKLPAIAVDCAGCLVDRHREGRRLLKMAAPTEARPPLEVQTAATVVLGTPVCIIHAEQLMLSVPEYAAR